MAKHPAANGLTIFSADAAKRRARDKLIDEWIKENPEFFLHLKKLSKDELIHRLARVDVGSSYDRAVANIFEVDEIHEAKFMLDYRLKNCLITETELVLHQWGEEMIKKAGKNKTTVAWIENLITTKRELIQAAPKIKAANKQVENLAAGRKDGVKARKKKAEEKMATLTKAVGALFAKPESKGWSWTNKEIFDFLSKTDYGYNENSLNKHVETLAAKCRANKT